ncbi:MAG: hypothetical protein HY290_00735 [Planctomycetia bacterium]|nr:hypothetical protein [Planctomycetia bacterium]
MPKNVRQIGFLGCFLLVLLRVAIGWQFLYEGIWKLDTQKTAKPWSAEGYLANARGPFRDKFRGMIDDPNGLDKLDYDKVAARWDDWRKTFLERYSGATDAEGKPIEGKLDDLLDGPKQFNSDKLEQLPPGVDNAKLKALKLPKGTWVRYNENEKAKRLETNTHFLPAERDALLALAKVKAEAEAAEGDAKAEPAAEPAGQPAAEPGTEGDAAGAAAVAVDPLVAKYQAAVKQLYARSGKLSLKERLQVLLKEDPDRIGVVHESHEGTVDYHRPGKVDVYRHLLERYEQNLKQARQTFHQEHLEKQWREIFEKKLSLVGPVDALTAEYHTAAYKLLKAEDFSRGPVPEPDSKIRQINQMTMWSLIILGVMLMAGFLSRLSALSAAGLLLMFYLPMPPWPGVPEAPGPEHALFVNKNLIEVFACLGLTAIPTGRWIGVDALIRRFILRRKTD